MIDLVLAGDSLAAAGLAPEQRRHAIIIGIVAATVFRIILADDRPVVGPGAFPAAPSMRPGPRLLDE